jgi:hypothetical protein
MKLGALTLGAYSLIIVISFSSISPFVNMECPSLSRLINVGLKYFVRDKYCYSCLFWGPIGLVNLLPASQTKSMLISVGEMGLL